MEYINSIKYKKYVFNHMHIICKMFEKYADALNNILDDLDLDKLKLQVGNHDLSKLSDEEFYDYRKKFYPVEGEKCDDESFNKAWLHHIKENNHHWNSWVYVDINNGKIEITAVEIPDNYLAELILDWAAMSEVNNGTPLDYYNNVKNGIVLHEKTRRKLELCLNELFK